MVGFISASIFPTGWNNLTRGIDHPVRRREVVNGARRIGSEKLRVHQYMEGYDRHL